MNRLPKSLSRTWLLSLLFLLGFPARADIVFPAHLQLSETSPGLFQVVFTLPVINGKILKAEPVFPKFCAPVSEPAVQVDSYQKITRWEIRCESASLHGQQIGIEGLLGSPIDILLEINTLDGRTYHANLSPSESYYQVPPPPGFSDYLVRGTLSGARSILGQWGLGLMFLAWLLMGSLSQFRGMLLAAILGASLGNFLGVQEWLLVPSWAGAMAAMLVSLALLLPRALGLQNGKPSLGGLVLIGLAALLAGGGLQGGAGLPGEVVPAGYTPGEMAILNLFSTAGIALGVLLVGLLVRQVLVVASLTQKDLNMPLSRGLAALSLGVLIWQGSLFWNYPSMLPAIPWALIGFVSSTALWTALLPGDEQRIVPAWLLPAFALGFLWGMWGIGIPLALPALWSVAPVFLLLVLFRASPSIPVHKALLMLGGLAAGNYLYLFADTTLSYPLARSVFFTVLLLLLALSAVSLSGRIATPKARKGIHKVLSGMLLALVLAAGISGLLEGYPETISLALSEGRLPLPLLSMGLFILAGLLWPRRRKIHRKMGLERKPPVMSLALVAAAFFFLPVSREVRNPWHVPGQMDQEALQGLVERRLRNTYTAFNIADEDELFDQLAENLDEDLLDHIYLDSRRRLTMGLREGSQVTVQDVSLGELGAPEAASGGEAGWTCPARWTVTARVKHLKHIHYRKNLYTGTIALKAMEDGWKISEIILTSEDRKVVASGSL